MTKIYIAIIKYEDEKDKRIVRIITHEVMDNFTILKCCLTMIFDDEFYFHNYVTVINNKEFFDRKRQVYFDFSVTS